jgi:transcriptional regulator with XRE-family HTH domain
VQPVPEPARALAKRLRALRKQGGLTQRKLGDHLNRSPGLISSWENDDSPVTPPVEQLEAYAALFGSLLHDTSVEALNEELLGLRLQSRSSQNPVMLQRRPESTLVGQGLWHFEGEEDDLVVIVCPQLPDDLLGRLPHTDPENPDYSEISRLTDLDALLELHGHIRAVNPDLRVEVRSVTDLESDHLTAHVVVLGGVDYNAAQRVFLRRSEVPVRQRSESDPDRGCFEVTGEAPESFPPVFDRVEGRQELVEDVGHFLRGPNPSNIERTITLCNGMFSRGVLGAVRTLTDKEMRDRNTQYIADHFAGRETFSILFRVPIVGVKKKVVSTPDWTAPGTVLHTWPETQR